MLHRKYFTRREALKALSLTIGIPLLHSLSPLGLLKNAYAAPKSRKKFIGCFWGAGADMPGGEDGDWNLNGALKIFRDLNLQNNLLLLRGVRAPLAYGDVHWGGTGAFMTCKRLRSLSEGEGTGKSFDQMIASANASKLGSLQVGWQDQDYHDSGQARDMGLTYINCISWKEERIPNRNINTPEGAFTRMFGGGQSNEEVKIQLLKRKSILDGVKQNYGSFKSFLSKSDEGRLESFFTSLRSLESELTNRLSNEFSCSNQPILENDGNQYRKQFKLYNKIIARAMECGAINVATVMFQNGIGDNQPHPEVGANQHESSHSAGRREASGIQNIQKIIRLEMECLADLVVQLKNSGVFSDTLILAGSNMSDGQNHNEANIPLLLLGEGSDLKFGQELNLANGNRGDRNSNRRIADLYMDLNKVYGLNLTSFGEGEMASTGQSLGIFT